MSEEDNGGPDGIESRLYASEVGFTSQAIALMAAWDRVQRAVADFDAKLVSLLAAPPTTSPAVLGLRKIEPPDRAHPMTADEPVEGAVSYYFGLVRSMTTSPALLAALAAAEVQRREQPTPTDLPDALEGRDAWERYAHRLEAILAAVRGLAEWGPPGSSSAVLKSDIRAILEGKP